MYEVSLTGRDLDKNVFQAHGAGTVARSCSIAGIHAHIC